MLLDGAFTVLVVLFIGSSAASVLCPTDVTVSCQNAKVTVSWKCSNQQPQTRFRVNLTGSPGHFKTTTTTEHQLDLSPFIWKSEEHYMDRYYVSVAATQGGRKSTPVKSKTFSFNYLKTIDMKCKLDFPPVDVNVKDSGATVTFINPLHFYRELQQANKSDDAHFSFRVTSDRNTSQDCNDCTVKEKNCKCDIVFPGAEKCVTLNGSLFSWNDVGEVMFRGSERICGEEHTEVNVITLVVMLSVVVLVIIVLTILICMARAWTVKTSDRLPWFLEWIDHEERESNNPNTVSISPIIVSVRSEEENTPIEEPHASSVSPELQPLADQYRARHLSESSSQEGHGTDSDSAADSEKTECVSMDLGEEERKEEWSAYDRPHAFEVDIGDGDMVTAYSKR